MNYIKSNFLNLVVLTLAFIILLQRCGNNSSSNIVKEIHYIDTSYVKKSGDTTINNFSKIKEIPYIITSKDTQYIADTNYNVLKQQFEQLRDSLLLTKEYTQNYKIDTTGSADVKTILFKNSILSQNFKYNIKYPVIKDSVVVQQKQKTQIYFGLGLLGNQSSLIKGAEINLSLKNEKDQIYEIGSQYLNNELIYKIGTKWKIKL